MVSSSPSVEERRLPRLATSGQPGVGAGNRGQGPIEPLPDCLVRGVEIEQWKAYSPTADYLAHAITALSMFVNTFCFKFSLSTTVTTVRLVTLTTIARSSMSTRASREPLPAAFWTAPWSRSICPASSAIRLDWSRVCAWAENRTSGAGIGGGGLASAIPCRDRKISPKDCGDPVPVGPWPPPGRRMAGAGVAIGAAAVFWMRVRSAICL